MLGPIYRRLLLSVPVMFVVSVLTFVLTAIIPGDPGRTLLGTQATPQAVKAINKSLGLDRPLYEQYWSWLEGVFHGDLGSSVFSGAAVTSLLNDALPITLTLIVGATAVAILLGVPLGVASARRPGVARRGVDVLSMLGFALPGFWLALLLVLLFSRVLGWLPPSGWVPFSDSPSGWLRSITLPVATLALFGISVIAKQTRDGMLDVLDSEYVRVLRLRGLSERSVVYKHALRNALPNVVTLVGLYVVSLPLGTALVETVFALQQGLGSVAIQATGQHDLPTLQGAAVYLTLIVVVVFCLVDLVRAWLNPKLRSGR
jgi:peptide/nickel transport system permease protein